MNRKKVIWQFPLVVMGVAIILTGGCKKDTNTPSAVTDFDGNIYHTITLGTQVWMVENLKVTHYRNGDIIPNVTDNAVWSNLPTGAYSDYNNIPDSSKTYGRLYNFYTILDSRNLAPTGWHVPTDAEWFTLINYLGSDSVAGGKMKEKGTKHWQTPNEGATNEIGFTGLPTGYRGTNGPFGQMGYFGYYWSSSEYDSGSALYRFISFDSKDVASGRVPKNVGSAVRCLKD
jgi:uncharacterized protein (TIGR02145 family)